jgi:eukaryotic-like serine/threonine-protein kinase
MADKWRVPGYTEVAELGRGGSGRVVAAIEESTGNRVAIKYLADRLASDPQLRAAFSAEARILSGLDLPNVVKVRGYAESGEGAAIVMDLAQGVSLRAVLAGHGPAGPKAALSVLRGSLSGLAGAHAAGIVHRDYKPENVMVAPDGTSMLVDFGIAARTGTPGRPAGTPGYAAPEQWSGAPASSAGDIYAAGVTFAEVAGGTTPREGPPATGGEPATVRMDAAEPIGARLASLIARATDPNPAARPADAAALLAELDDAARDRYGAGWYDEGRAALAAAAAALLAVGSVAAAASAAAAPAGPRAAVPAQGPSAAATTLAPTRRFRRLGRAGRAGHAPAWIAAGAAGVVIIAGTVIAVAAVGHHQSSGRRTGGSGPSASAPASPGSSHQANPSSSPSPSRTVLAVNPANPCTWLTRADFARNGIKTGRLHPGSFPGGWKACRNGRYYVGVRGTFLHGCGPLTFVLSCRNVSVPGASSAQYLVASVVSEAELHAERGSLQYSIGVPKGAAGLAALIRLMELVLTRTAAAS